MFARPPSQTRSRSGAILAMVLASMLIASLLGLALVKTVLIHHRQMQVVGRQQQCFWLAEAGVERAVAKLRDSSAYEGEQWQVSAETLGVGRAAVVSIRIGKSDISEDARTLVVEARFVGEPPWPNAYRRELAVSFAPDGS